MGGEDDVGIRASHALRKQRDETGVVVPAVDEGDRGPAVDGVVHLLPVAGDRTARVVRGEDEADDRPRAGCERRFDGRSDPRLPVLHPGEDRRAQLQLQRIPRLLGDGVEWVRVLDPEPAVALDEILQ